MRLQLIPAVTFLLGSLLSLSCADDPIKPLDSPRFFESRSYDISKTLTGRENEGDDIPAVCRTLCSPQTCGGSCPTKLRRNSNVVELDRRVLENPTTDAERDAYVFARTQRPQLISIYTNQATTTKVWRSINAGTTGALDIGLKELIGCTTLVVASPNGVYASHHWEVPSFSPRIENGAVTEEVTFDSSVIQYLQSTGANGLAAHANELDGGVAYILTPASEADATQPEYGDKINQMITAINAAVPNLTGVQVSTYVALEGGLDDEDQPINAADDLLLRTTSRGRVLFQYDPRNNGLRTMRLFFENTQVFSVALQ